MKKEILAFLLIFYSLQGNAQRDGFVFLWEKLPFEYGEHVLVNPTAGGLNTCQFSTIDLNGDGREDLFLLDRSTDKISTFLAVGEGQEVNFRYAPFYEYFFPEIHSWCLLVDYDLDGKKDIFTHTNLGIKVFRNMSEGGVLQFEEVKAFLETENQGQAVNLFVLGSDIPAILDLDEDGDVDILTFSQGNTLILHEGQTRAGLDFMQSNSCWGNFREGDNCGDFQFGVDCEVVSRKVNSGKQRMMHAGSSALVLDIDGDGIKDLLLGDVDCRFAYAMINTATNKQAVFEAVERFPDPPILISDFPAFFYEDVDFDGEKDLLAAPNLDFNDVGLSNFHESNWFYKNRGTTAQPSFELVKKNFLQGEMIDVGEGSSPSLIDIDGDGDRDLLVSNRGRQNDDGFYSKLFLYKNTGSISEPYFHLEEEDYLNFSEESYVDLHIAWRKLDQNESLDLIFWYREGLTYRMYYVLNEAPVQEAPSLDRTRAVRMNLPMALRLGDHPFWYDYNSDGILDLLLGRQQGNVACYVNQGTNENPDLILENENFGGIEASTDNSDPSIAIADIDQNGHDDLLIATYKGEINIYPDFHRQEGVFEKLTQVFFNPLMNELVVPKLGRGVQLAVQDIDQDNYPDIFFGTYGGGIGFLKNVQTSPILSIDDEQDEEIRLYPNPAQDHILISPKEDMILEIHSLLGQLCYRSELKKNKLEKVSFNLSPGVYRVSIVSKNKKISKKLIIKP